MIRDNKSVLRRTHHRKTGTWSAANVGGLLVKAGANKIIVEQGINGKSAAVVTLTATLTCAPSASIC